MTIDQMRLWLREGEKLKRQERVAFIADMNAAMPGPLGESEKAQDAIDRLTQD